jgi:LCP family protein required for cell wall assembly
MNELELVRRYRSDSPRATDAATADARDRLDAVMLPASAPTPSDVRSVGLTPRRSRSGARVLGARLAIALVLIGALVVAAVSVIDRSIDERLEAVSRVPISRGALTPGPAIGHGPNTFLVVGTDSGVVLPSGSTSTSSRSDVMVLVRVTRASTRAIWVPRDLALTPTDGGAPVKANSLRAISTEAMIAGLSSSLGVEINHYVEVDFGGFAAIVDELGGLTVSFDTPVRDELTGFDASAGCVRLDGDEALALMRSRWMFALRDGIWELTQASAPDLFRIATQQATMERLARQVRDRVEQKPARAVRLFDRLLQHVSVDATLTSADLRGLARVLADAHEVSTATLPVVLNDLSTLGLDPSVPVSELLTGTSPPATGFPGVQVTPAFNSGASLTCAP